MYINTFRNFIEIESLKSKILVHQTNLIKEKKRISDVASKRLKSAEDIKHLETEIADLKLKELELQISSLEINLRKLKTQMDMVKNEKELTSLNHEIKHTEDKKNELENNYFLNLESSETKTIQIKDLKEFLKGSEESLKEIEVDVNQNITLNEKEIAGYTARIESLLSLENISNQKLYNEMSVRFKTTSACAFILSKNCSACRINIDSQTVNNVENARSIELCPSCGRILLPKDLNLY